MLACDPALHSSKANCAPEACRLQGWVNPAGYRATRVRQVGMVANAEVAVSGKDALDCRTPSSLFTRTKRVW